MDPAAGSRRSADQIRERNEGGAGLATAGIVLGGLLTAFTVLMVLLAIGPAVGSAGSGT